MKPLITALIMLALMSSVSAVTFQSGVELSVSENFTWTMGSSMTVTTFDMTDGVLTLDDVAINITSATGDFNVTVNSWTDTDTHNLVAVGEGQTVNFEIMDATTSQVVIYDDIIYQNSFTALTSSETFDWGSEYNITLNFYDEDGYILMSGKNVTVSLISEVLGSNYTTTTGVLEIPSLASDTYIIQYNSDGYEQRSYYFDYVEGLPTNLTLFLGNTTLLDGVAMNVYDTLGNRIQGAMIKISKYFAESTSYELVETAETNFQGEAQASLELNNAYYRFLIEYEGEQVYSANPTIIYSNSLNFYIDLTDTSIDEMFSQFGLSGTLSYDNLTDRLTYTWNDESNTATQGCVKIYKMMQSGPSYIDQSCGASPAGTVYYDLTPENGASYQFKGYIKKGGTDFLVATGSSNFKTPLPDSQSGLFFMFIVMVAFAFLFLWDPIVAVIAEGIVPLLFTIAGLSPLGYEIVVPVFFLCIVVGVVIGVGRK